MSDKLNHSGVQAFATAYQSPLPVLLFFQNTFLRKRVTLSREMELLSQFDAVEIKRHITKHVNKTTMAVSFTDIHVLLVQAKY
jgi:hypothetical protein